MYIVELARRKPTKIRCMPGQQYKLQKGALVDLGNSEVCLVENISTRYEDEELEVNTLENRPKLKFRCLAGMYKSLKHEIKVSRHEDEQEFLIGRVPKYEMCLARDGIINRTHAKITYSDDMYWEIEDLGSTTGTFICIGKGKCYTSKSASDVDVSRELEEGDIISIPNVDFTFKYL